MFAEWKVFPLSAPLQSIRWARKAVLSQNSLMRAKRFRIAQVHEHEQSHLFKPEIRFWRGVWTFLEASACLESSRERKVQVPESLRDFVVWRSTETRAWRGSRPESLRWVCEWLWDPRGGGDIPTTCISTIFHLSLLFVVQEASQLCKAKSFVGSSL